MRSSDLLPLPGTKGRICCEETYLDDSRKFNPEEAPRALHL